MTEELLGDAPIEPHLRAVMTDLAADLDNRFNPGLKGAERMAGFVLLVFPREGCEGLVNYISNTNRAEVVTMLKEQLARFAPEGRHWRHVTSGMFVTEIGRGRMQTAEPIGDMTPIVIYHHAGEHGGGTFWVRPVAEFEDGRFVELLLAETEGKP